MSPFVEFSKFLKKFRNDAVQYAKLTNPYAINFSYTCKCMYAFTKEIKLYQITWHCHLG